jgi:glyoxylase-like metal-dependent hydrolase (beta-lactamase superfamily II)
MFPLYTEFAFTRGGAHRLSPLVRRIVAKDATPNGYAGTRAYLVGRGEIAVVDPFPASPALLETILRETRGERISRIFITHGHGQPSELALELARRTGALIHGAPSDRGLDGTVFEGQGWTIEALATPGHTADHLAFALRQESTLFCGDLVSGWSPEVMIPTGGDLDSHLASLDKVRRRAFSVLWPAHGAPVTDVEPFLAECVAKSRQRAREILEALESDQGLSAWDLAARLHPKVNGLVQPAAAHAILAHLVRLAGQGRLVAAGRASVHVAFARAECRAA